MKEVFKGAWRWVILEVCQVGHSPGGDSGCSANSFKEISGSLGIRSHCESWPLKKLWLLLQMVLGLARSSWALKSLEKMSESLSQAIWSPFAEMLNYEPCLWLPNILILLRFKILALSPNPNSNEIFLYFSVVRIGAGPWMCGWSLYTPSHSLVLLSVALLWKVISHLSALPEMQ